MFKDKFLHKGVSCLMSHHFSARSAIPINAAVKCVDWYNAHKHLKQEHRYISSQLPKCPCDVRLARFDPWFWRIFWQWRRHSVSDIICVDIAPAQMIKPYGKVYSK